mmetsp:Transcript_20608/g.56877  ORF Transcript_20608/g.56877 Transcript_20608/m.56877 type:complete len:473 (-) Transcript_20608:79-1497(-)
MIEYTEDWLIKLLFRLECKITVRALLYALPAAALAVLLCVEQLSEFTEAAGMQTITDDLDVKRSQTWLVLTGILVLMLEFRTEQALQRFWEGTSLLHQMRGEWFDSISCCVTWSILAVESKPNDVKVFRHTIVRLMSLCHGAALEEIGDADYVVEKLDLAGIDSTTRSVLTDFKERYEFNKVEAVLHIIITLITKAHDDGVLKIAPPILTRVYQTLSRGYVCLLNAKKISDTRFPFPYAQLITLLLMLHMVVLPVMLAMLLRTPLWAGVFTLLPLFGMFTVNFIASELENPYGHDDNDLPLSEFQADMNKSLLMLLHGRADHFPSVQESCIRDFGSLMRSMNIGGRKMSTGCNRSGMTYSNRSVSRMSSFEEIDFEDTEELPPERAALAEEREGEEADEDLHSPRKVLPEDPLQGPPAAEFAQKQLSQSMQKFNRTLQKWTRTVESQVGELRRSLEAVKQLGERAARGARAL